MNVYFNADYFKSYQYNRSRLGDFYEEQWGGLQPREINWLNKFQAPFSHFLQLAVARDATVRLYLAVLPELERRSKEAGSSLPKDAKELEILAKEYAQYQRWGHNASRSLAGHKAGATVYYTIFGRCENAVRSRFDVEEVSDTYFTSFAGADESFDTFFGDYLDELLPPLAAALPPPDEATEVALNQFETTRWEPRYEALLPLLLTDPAAFATGVHRLGRQNERNPAIAPLYLEAARQLGELGHDPEQVVRFYFYYLYYGGKYRHNFKPKPLLKRLEKRLFKLPEQLARYEALRQELLRSRDLPPASEAVPTIWQQERRKIELDPAAVQTARRLHRGTVALLNEVLQDEPAAPSPAGTFAPGAVLSNTQRERRKIELDPAAVQAAHRLHSDTVALLNEVLQDEPAAAPTNPPVAVQAAAPALPPAAADTFAPGVALSTTQQALLLLFAAHHLALSQAKVEAFAKSHGTLRNQLIDSVNDACYALLDDVLVEESGDGYTIYEAYYQRLIAAP